MDPYLGQIQLYPYDFEPKGWALCDGRKLPINMNEALYSLIGTQFGGDGQTSFCLPDLTDKGPAPEVRYYIALQGIFPQRY